tara:strand:- start:110 stop:280 length:171 start_codon:yes stop_codon:yes gene_type:complete
VISPIEKGGLNLGERSNFHGSWKRELGVFISLKGIIVRKSKEGIIFRFDKHLSVYQ